MYPSLWVMVQHQWAFQGIGGDHWALVGTSIMGIRLHQGPLLSGHQKAVGTTGPQASHWAACITGHHRTVGTGN